MCENPFAFRFSLLDRSLSDLVCYTMSNVRGREMGVNSDQRTFHLEPRAYFCELYLPRWYLDKNMVSTVE